MDCTIVVSPRERFCSIVPSLKSLFATIPPGLRVIVVEGDSPTSVRRQLGELATQFEFEHVALDYLVAPNEARNIGAEMATTRWLVLADNDVEYEPGWLEALINNAEHNEADMVGPLIFIGPAKEKTIHHAGGMLVFGTRDGKPTVKEAHRLMNASYDDVKDLIPQKAPLENEVCEFHCLLMSKAFWERMGGLDERLVTRDQMDVGLRAKALGAKVTFEINSRVSYRARDPLEPEDLAYFLFRWSDHRTVQSMDAFEETWALALNRKRIRYGWVAKHRRRAATSAYPRLFKIWGLHKIVMPILEHRSKIREKRSRQDLKRQQRLPAHKVGDLSGRLSFADAAHQK